MPEDNEDNKELNSGIDESGDSSDVFVPVQSAEHIDSPEGKMAAGKGESNEVWEWAKSIIFALALALFLKATVVQSYMIPTQSMVPTIMPRDRVFGNRFIFHFKDPRPGDVIAFKPPPEVYGSHEYPDSGEKGFQGFYDKTFGKDRIIPYLKRVVAVEGDTVEISGGKVIRNNVPLDEPYLNCDPNYEYPPEKVPKDMLFVMGDNRCNSHDSHVWGFLPKKNVQAKAFFRFWPPNRIGVVR